MADALGEVVRGLHAQVLSRLDIDVPAIRVWGDEYRRIGRCESDYHTLAGTVRVMRTVYRKTGRNGDTLDPVSVRARRCRRRLAAAHGARDGIHPPRVDIIPILRRDPGCLAALTPEPAPRDGASPVER